MNSSITGTFTVQCPHCQTDVHLQRNLRTTALGDVHCETCKQAFNAARQISHPANVSPTARKPSVTFTQDAPQRNVTPATVCTLPLTLNDDIDLGDLDTRSFIQDARPLVPNQQSKKRSSKIIIWTLLSNLTLLLLLSLYIYSNFHQFARQDSTRPWLTSICQVLDCELPPKVDIEQIKSSNLQVRSHPDFSGAILVNAIIYNRAAYNQSFPLVELIYLNQHDQPLSSRLFKSSQYLSDMDVRQQMQPQTPIHIAIETLKPSEDTVNYRLNFISPD